MNPFRIKLKTIIGYCLLSFTATLMAIEVNTLVKDAQILMDAEKIDQAYELLEPIADDHAGIPEFDYLYGLLLQRKNQHTYAVMVLERALLIRPQHSETREALVKSYLQLQEFSRAKKLKPSLVIHQTKKENKGYHFTGFIRTTGGYDDNLTSGADHNFVTIPILDYLGPTYIGRGLEKDQDFFFSVSGVLGLKKNISKNVAINVGLWGSKRFNRQRPDEELATLSSWFRGSYQFDKNNFKVNVKYQSLWINTLQYQHHYALQGQWYRPLFKSNALALHFNVSTTHHPNSDILDADAYTLGLVFYQQFNWLWRPMLSLAVQGGEETLKETNYAYLGYEKVGTHLTTQLHFNEINRFLISGSYQNKYYKASNPFFLRSRHDHHYSVTGKYTHLLFNKQLELSLQGTWILNRSNISLYDYQRNLATINMQWNF